MCLKGRIAEILASREYRQIRNHELAPSAVLLLLFEKEGECHVLFTRRSDKVAYHKDEISFPGGTIDPDDSDLLHTALREVAEEIGLDSRDVQILGRLDDLSTLTTGFMITPYVGVFPYPYKFQINTDEIAELIYLPLRVLAEECHVEASELTQEGKNLKTYYFHVKDYIIWGATARILKQFIDLTYKQ
jgi:8-oxo-dGTP pyrophosphatase MutT (NUDIX family)